MLSYALTSHVPWPLLAVLLVVLVLAGLARVMHTAALAIEGLDAYPPVVETREAPRTPVETRWPVEPSASLWSRLKGRVTCLRRAHEDIYTFRLGRPAHRCRRCGRWRAYDVIVDFPRERRA